MKAQFTKEQFLAATRCLTQGWYTVHAPAEPITPGLAWKFWTGQEIGRLAREQLGRGVQLPRSPVDTALAATAAAMGDPARSLLFEATFLAGGFAARADALRRNGATWDVIEVKSGKIPDEEPPEDKYLDDLAYTVFVARSAGVPIGRCLLMLIRREYRLGVEGELLAELDVTAEVIGRAEGFALAAPGIAAALGSEPRPAPALILACRDCPYLETDCLGKGVPDSIFLLPRLSAKRFEDLKQYGRISALPADAKLTPPQQRVASVIRTGRPEEDPAGLALLDQVTWPVYYLDFESVNPALPWFDGAAPYEAMPFQFSLHVRKAPGQATVHHEYLAPIDKDWRLELAESLLDRLGTAGSVLTYSAYEKRMLNYLASVLEGLRPRIEAVIARLFDLEPVVRTGYCHPAFRGRSSIKYVLPAMVPELSYEGLTIRGGEDAGGVFALMYVDEYNSDQHESHRNHLLEYCKLDTLAMVRVHEELGRIRARLG